MYRYKRRHQREDMEQLDRWLVSYADYMTLMFALFVVMYAYAMLKQERLQQLSDVIVETFAPSGDKRHPASGILEEGLKKQPIPLDGEQILPARGSKPVDGFSALSDLENDNTGKALEDVRAELHLKFNDVERHGLLTIHQDEDWLVLEMNSGLLFASGSATPTANARVVLSEIGKVLGQNNNYIRVRGYTDSQPIQTELYSSNWDLSALRASAVVDLLSESVQPERLAIEAYGAFRPIADNATADGRARNRRVEIAVSKYAWVPEPVINEVIPFVAAPEEQPLVEMAEEMMDSEQEDIGQIRIIRLPGGGIRITSREE